MTPDIFRTAPHTRRSFLKFGAAVAAVAGIAGVPFGGARLSAVEDPAPAAAGAIAGTADEYGGLVMGIQSYTLRDRSLEKVLEAMANELKVHAVELYPGHTAKPLTPPKVKELLDKHGVKAMSYGVIPFKKDEAHNRSMFEIAKTYGMKNLSCDPDDNKETFDSLEKLTEEYGVTVAIHPHGPGHKWGKTEQLEKAYAGRSNRIGLCADTGHIIRAGEDPLKVMTHFKDRVHALHLKDFKKKDDGKNWEDVPAGTANLDVDAVVKFLLDNKSRAPVFIEYEGGDPVASAKKSLERVKAAVKKAKA